MIKLEFIELKPFEKDFKKAGLTDDDMRYLQSEIIRNPNVGDIEEGTKGLRKMRFQSVGGKGKSGGSRVHYIILDNICYLISFIPKNVAENLSKAERNNIAKFIDGLKRFHENLLRLESVSMGKRTYYDYIKEGLLSLESYLNGDTSQGKNCTIPVEELSFAESNKKDFKLKIRESNNSADTIILCSNCIDAIRSRGERVHQLDFDIPEDKLREPTEEEIDEYGFSDWDMVGTCEWCDDLCTEDDLTVCSF